MALLTVLGIAVLVPVIQEALLALQGPAARRRAQGHAEARCDIRNGVLKLKTYGLPGPWRGQYSTWLKQQYGVELEAVAAGMLTGDSKCRVDGYNELMNAELAKRNGVPDFTALSRDAWSAYVREQPFPLRTDPPPKEWKASQVNEGLPRRQEKGVVHVLVWEVIEDDRPWKYTHVLVLKKFDQPTERQEHNYNWVLAQVYHHPEDSTWPWQGPMRHFSPPPPHRLKDKLSDAQLFHLTDAQLFGWEYYDDPPTDEQIKTFLNETHWTPDLGTSESFSLSDKGVQATKVTKKLTAGGIDRALWMMLFDRDVPTDLFPELKKASDDTK